MKKKLIPSVQEDLDQSFDVMVRTGRLISAGLDHDGHPLYQLSPEAIRGFEALGFQDDPVLRQKIRKE